MPLDVIDLVSPRQSTQASKTTKTTKNTEESPRRRAKQLTGTARPGKESAKQASANQASARQTSAKQTSAKQTSAKQASAKQPLPQPSRPKHVSIPQGWHLRAVRVQGSSQIKYWQAYFMRSSTEQKSHIVFDYENADDHMFSKGLTSNQTYSNRLAFYADQIIGMFERKNSGHDFVKRAQRLDVSHTANESMHSNTTSVLFRLGDALKHAAKAHPRFKNFVWWPTRVSQETSYTTIRSSVLVRLLLWFLLLDAQNHQAFATEAYIKFAMLAFKNRIPYDNDVKMLYEIYAQDVIKFLLAACNSFWTIADTVYPGEYVLAASAHPPVKHALIQSPSKSSKSEGKGGSGGNTSTAGQNESKVVMHDDLSNKLFARVQTLFLRPEGFRSVLSDARKELFRKNVASCVHVVFPKPPGSVLAILPQQMWNALNGMFALNHIQQRNSVALVLPSDKDIRDLLENKHFVSSASNATVVAIPSKRDFLKPDVTRTMFPGASPCKVFMRRGNMHPRADVFGLKRDDVSLVYYADNVTGPNHFPEHFTNSTNYVTDADPKKQPQVSVVLITMESLRKYQKHARKQDGPFFDLVFVAPEASNGNDQVAKWVDCDLQRRSKYEPRSLVLCTFESSTATGASYHA